jgi:hypothetical protein
MAIRYSISNFLITRGLAGTQLSTQPPLLQALQGRLRKAWCNVDEDAAVLRWTEACGGSDWPWWCLAVQMADL